MADSYLCVHRYFLFFVCDDIYHIMESYGASNSGLKTNYEKTYLLYFFHCVACLVILSAPDTRSDFSKSFNLSFSTQEAFSFCNCQETIACQIIHPYLWSDRTSDSRAPWFLSGYQSFKVLVGLWRHTSLSALSHLMFSLSKFYTERLYSQRFASCLWQKSVRNCMYLFFFNSMLPRKAQKARFHLNKKIGYFNFWTRRKCTALTDSRNERFIYNTLPAFWLFL